MFGPIIRIVREDGFGILMRPMTKEEVKLPMFRDGMSSLRVNLHTGRISGKSEDDEVEWYEKTRKSTDSYLWAIQPDGCDHPVGSTSISEINDEGFSCSTGIIIYDKGWQSRGVGGLSHLARTWFVANVLNQNSIATHIVDGNIRSRKALESVGYFITGRYLRDRFRPTWDNSEDGIDPVGSFRDTLVLCWLNPYRVQVLYPEGLPPEYEVHVERAKLALARARQLVQLI